jgi:hypothetical protein
MKKTTKTSVEVTVKLFELISDTDLCEAVKKFTEVRDDAKITFSFHSSFRLDHYRLELQDIMNLDVTAEVVHVEKSDDEAGS